MAIVSIDKMADAIMEELNNYADVCEDALKEAVDTAAKTAVSQLKATSPQKTGAYAKSWAQKKDQNASGAGKYGKVVYSKMPGLPHLLEFGHDIVRGGKKYGSVRAIPHIADAEQTAEKILVDRLSAKL